MPENNFSVSNTAGNELNLHGVTLSLSFNWKYRYGVCFPENQTTPTKGIQEPPEFARSNETHSAESTALVRYLWLLVMTAGVPLVALCIQSDGGPHATGGTEPEDEP